MPTSYFRLSRLLLASGLLMVLTFASARAQEVPLDPGFTDIPLAEKQPAALVPVTQLAAPENDYPNCAPPQQAWHPPIYYPKPETFCPTGVVHRDWWREKTAGFFAGRRQRMLEQDYQWRMENGWQSPCCPPHTCWGHSCDCCDGIGCHPAWRTLSESSHGECAPCTDPHCPVHGDHTSAAEETVEPVIIPATFEEEPTVGFGDYALALLEDDGEPGEILLVSEQQPVASAVETAGFCEVSDSCTQGNCYRGHNHCYHNHCFSRGHGHICPLHGHHCPHGHRCPIFGHGGYDDECEDDGCDCHLCCLKRRFCRCLYGDGLHGHWPRELCPIGFYNIAYPVNPHHFDQRDGRIYAAQGYGHPVAVPLAPNVEHTYNYGWGIPSSRLSPVSRMPGAPGVAIPPGPAGVGVYPPIYASPFQGSLMNPQ